MFRAGALILFAVFLTAAAPIPLKKPAAQTRQQDASHEERGTEAAPVIVKVLPAEPTQAQLAREDAQNKEKAAVDARLVNLTGDLALYTKLLFFATAILALLTAGLVRVGFLQVRDAKDTIAATKKAAEAAEINAKIALAQALPKVRITGVALGEWKTFTECAPEEQETLKPRLAAPTLMIYNHGNTNAIVTALGTGRAVGPKPPKLTGDPDYSPYGLIGEGVIVGADKPMQFEDSGIVLTEEQRGKVNSAEWSLWYWGKITIRDFLKEETEIGFIFRWNTKRTPHQFIMADVSGYTFQREVRRAS